jgi:hypothetical protein
LYYYIRLVRGSVLRSIRTDYGMILLGKVPGDNVLVHMLVRYYPKPRVCQHHVMCNLVYTIYIRICYQVLNGTGARNTILYD